MNANQQIIESKEEHRTHKAPSLQGNKGQESPSSKPLRLLQSHVMDTDAPIDSFKNTALVFGRALSALFR